MAYRVVTGFKDLRDGGYEYKSGDSYPHSGAADPARAKHLMTPTDQRGALIEEVSEPAPATTVVSTKRKKKEA